MNHLVEQHYCQTLDVRINHKKILSNFKDLTNVELPIKSNKNFAYELKLQKKNFKCLLSTELHGRLLILKCTEGLM